MWSYACSRSKATSPDGMSKSDSKGALQRLEPPFGTDNGSAWDSDKDKVNGLAQTVDRHRSFKPPILPPPPPSYYKQSFSCHLANFFFFRNASSKTVLVKSCHHLIHLKETFPYACCHFYCPFLCGFVFLFSSLVNTETAFKGFFSQDNKKKTWFKDENVFYFLINVIFVWKLGRKMAWNKHKLYRWRGVVWRSPVCPALFKMR